MPRNGPRGHRRKRQRRTRSDKSSAGSGWLISDASPCAYHPAAMNRRVVLAAYRVGFALLAIVAVVAQIAALPAGVFNPVNFFSYFTIQSNVIGVAVFLIGAARSRSASSAQWELVRGAAALY